MHILLDSYDYDYPILISEQIINEHEDVGYIVEYHLHKEDVTNLRCYRKLLNK